MLDTLHMQQNRPVSALIEYAVLEIELSVGICKIGKCCMDLQGLSLGFPSLCSGDFLVNKS